MSRHIGVLGPLTFFKLHLPLLHEPLDAALISLWILGLKFQRQRKDLLSSRQAPLMPSVDAINAKKKNKSMQRKSIQSPFRSFQSLFNWVHKSKSNPLRLSIARCHSSRTSSTSAAPSSSTSSHPAGHISSKIETHIPDLYLYIILNQM